MKNLIRSAVFGMVIAFATRFPAHAASPIDCNCLTNLPGLVVTCPGTIPDFCAIGTNCFTANVLPGSCTQNLPPGMQLPAGNYSIQVQVMDLQSNVFTCAVPFTVNPPSPTPKLTVICPTNKTVECGPGWTFDLPIVTSSCCGVTIAITTNYTTGSCPKVNTREWQITDGCGNVAVCSQQVTEVDTTPPTTQCNGQNLVPNGDFESFTTCPSAISQFDYAAPWFTPTDGTSDYYNSCSGPNSFVSTPTNSIGVQVPLSGQGYAGAALYSIYGTNPTNSYREYLEVPLVTTLTPGQKYLVSFYVSRAESFGLAIADISARFMPVAYTMFGPPSNLYSGVLSFPTPPQVSNPPSNIITDSTNWTLIQGVYTAIGWESHLILGNFKDDPNTTATFVGGAFTNFAYYYFDNVSVVAICDPDMTNKVVQCGDPWDIPPFPVIDNCSGGNITVSNYTTTNGYCPKVVQRDWYLEDQCGNTNHFTQTVTIVDTNPPVLMCSGGANLVPNPQFENYAFCPYFFDQVYSAAPWFKPTVATSDYMNTCSTFFPVQVPTNAMGIQTPLSGNGYMGAFVYSVYGTNPVPGYREYIEAPLLAPLQAGTTYQVSFHVSLADYSGWAIAEIGAHFSNGPLLDGSTQGPLNVIPQVENPSANLLTSTNGWMLVQGTFIAAGGEDHITLGNFRNDANTTATTAWGTNHAYYYFDDVSVVPLCSFTNKTVMCDSQWDFDTPLAYDECSGDYLSVFVTSTTTTGTCPKVHTRVWTIYDACANSMMATQVVTEIDTKAPMLLCDGVNLVPNGDFEDYLSCPPAFSFLSLAQPWQGWSSEFFHACASPASGVSVPSNFIGTQMPFSGSGYGGCYVYFNTGNSSNSIREYLETPLIAPLIAGQSYAVSFRVSRADNCTHAIAQIGAAFSTGNISNYFALTPQVVNPASNIITNAVGWTLIAGTFVASGGENTLTLGNFLQDASTTAQFVGPGPANNTSYYYFDDVKVTAVCTNVPVKTVACGAPWTFDPAPIGVDRCSGSNVTVTLASTVTNSTCPLNAVRTWTLTDACGNSTNWSQTVKAVTNGSTLTVNCGCLQDGYLNLLTTNACSAVIPNLSVLTNSPCIVSSCGNVHIAQSPAAGTVVDTGSHPITVSIYDCAGHTNICELPFYVSPPQPAINCPTNIYVLTCSNSLVVNFSVTASNNIGPVVCSPPSGSAFPLGTNLVTCTATNNCGGVATCAFYVVVRPPHPKFACFTKVIGVIIVGNSPNIVHLPNFTGGGEGVDLTGLAGNGQDGVRFDFGPAQKFTFSTVLDFAAPDGAGFDLANYDANSGTSETLLSFRSSCPSNCNWSITKPISGGSTASYRSIAVGTNGELFSSFTQSAAELGANTLLNIHSMNGSTCAVVTVTFDCRSGEVALEFPNGTWTPDNARKGWDGCIYGNGPRGTKTNKTARLILTPLGTPPTQITNLDLITTNLTTLAFDNPSITVANRKWGDGHVTLMKAYDDGEGMEFFSLGDGGGVNTGLGHAQNFRVGVHHFETGDIPTEEQIFRITGFPPGTTTNRPPVFNVRFAQNAFGTGVDCSADFTDWAVSNVTVQLWNGTTLVAESNHVPATLDTALVTLDRFPGILDCPSIGMLRISDTNPITVSSGFDCGTMACMGTELRILPELTGASMPPTAFTGLTCLISDGMDNMIDAIQTTPACSPVPLNVNPGSSGITLDWQGDGFRLQGAETLDGPWYDLGVESPVTLPAGYSMRFYRLVCD